MHPLSHYMVCFRVLFHRECKLGRRQEWLHQGLKWSVCSPPAWVQVEPEQWAQLKSFLMLGHGVVCSSSAQGACLVLTSLWNIIPVSPWSLCVWQICHRYDKGMQANTNYHPIHYIFLSKKQGWFISETGDFLNCKSWYHQVQTRSATETRWAILSPFLANVYCQETKKRSVCLSRSTVQGVKPPQHLPSCVSPTAFTHNQQDRGDSKEASWHQLKGFPTTLLWLQAADFTNSIYAINHWDENHELALSFLLPSSQDEMCPL